MKAHNGILYHAIKRIRRPRAAAVLPLIGIFLLSAASAQAGGRERAVEQIPELMGRILESQEEIRATESDLGPGVALWNERLEGARDRIERASSEGAAAEALVDYVEAYNQRLELQADGLDAIRAPIVRMHADAKQLVNAARSLGGSAEPPETRRTFFQGHFQGLASGLSKLSRHLGREDEGQIAGSVLEAGWGSYDSPQMPLAELGPEGALAFARRTEGLFARYQARASQLDAEQVAVRRLLDLLLERQLAKRLDTLFEDGTGTVLGDLFAANGTEDWGDLGDVVSRAIGLPGSRRDGRGSRASLDSLEYFASGTHRE